MKLTKSYLIQLICEELQKEGFGDWLKRMRAADEESGARYREKLAARGKEKEEPEEEEEEEEFFESGFGSGLKKALKEEWAEPAQKRGKRTWTKMKFPK